MNERTLVSLRTISALEPIDGADFIEKAFVDGWTVVVKKGEYAVGDPVVYFEPDAFLPEVLQQLVQGNSPVKLFNPSATELEQLWAEHKSNT